MNNVLFSSGKDPIYLYFFHNRENANLLLGPLVILKILDVDMYEKHFYDYHLSDRSCKGTWKFLILLI